LQYPSTWHTKAGATRAQADARGRRWHEAGLPSNHASRSRPRNRQCLSSSHQTSIP
jgi:hypothetical protein